MSAIAKFTVLLLVPSVSYYSIWSKQNLEIFNVAGSSSAQNIFNALLQGEKDYSVAISNTGSAMGLDYLEKGKSHFALVSYDISEWLKESSRSNKYKAIKLADESIVVAYKRPSMCTQDLEITKENAKDFFALFFGKQQANQNIKTNLKDLIGNSDDKCSAVLTTIVKSSGPTKSGTVKSLFSFSLLNSDTSHNEWLKEIKQGYGKDSNLVFIQESGLMHAEHFLENVNDGWITYLPSSFVEKNWDRLINKGVKFAKIKFDNNSIEFQKGNSNNNGSYKWTRPFNLVYSIENNELSQKAKEFVKKIVTNLSRLNNIYLKNNTSLNANDNTLF